MRWTLLETLGLGAFVTAQTTSSGAGYVGYNLTFEGDNSKDSVVYSTDGTNPNVTYKAPDVYLNASVHVGEIDIEVDNLTAKINLDAQVLNLLQFNAGVDVSIDQVKLLIEQVNAKVLLEARLENIVLMIGDVLDSLDLNPVLATLGQDVGQIVNTTASGLTGSSGALGKRSYDLVHNIVYSVNNYAGDTHTNRILAQNGDLVDQYLDNDGNPHGSKVVGSYATDMTYSGHESQVEFNGETVTEKEYVYSPYRGIDVVSAIYLNAAGKVVGTQVLAESGAGGSSSIGDL